MERAIRERMSSANEVENLMPQDLINAKPAAASIREFLVLVNCLSLWIKLILFQKLLTKKSFSFGAWGFNKKERV